MGVMAGTAKMPIACYRTLGQNQRGNTDLAVLAGTRVPVLRSELTRLQRPQLTGPAYKLTRLNA